MTLKKNQLTKIFTWSRTIITTIISTDDFSNWFVALDFFFQVRIMVCDWSETRDTYNVPETSPRSCDYFLIFYCPTLALKLKENCHWMLKYRITRPYKREKIWYTITKKEITSTKFINSNRVFIYIQKMLLHSRVIMVV